MYSVLEEIYFREKVFLGGGSFTRRRVSFCGARLRVKGVMTTVGSGGPRPIKGHHLGMDENPEKVVLTYSVMAGNEFFLKVCFSLVFC